MAISTVAVGPGMLSGLNCYASRRNSAEFTLDRLRTMDEDDMTVPQLIQKLDGRMYGLGWDSREATSEAERGRR
jgi:hypothetical protein